MPHPADAALKLSPLPLLPGHPATHRHPIAVARRRQASLFKQRLAEHEPLPVEPSLTQRIRFPQED